MKVAIIYSSITGNTKLLAETIKSEIKEEIVYFGKPINEEIDADVYFIGSWTNKGDAANDIINFLKNLKNKKIVYFGTAGYGGSTVYYDTLFSRVKQYIDSSNTIVGHFYCQGKMPTQVKERYIKMITENPNDKNLKVSLKNFEDALTHPDKKDLENVKNWVNETFTEMKYNNE